MSQHGTLGDHWGFIGQLGIIGASLRDHLVPGYEPFLATILDAPYEDAPRLVYADWLEEQGDPRAEFIRAQCERLRLPPDDPEFAGQRERREDREGKLLLAYGDGWRAEIPEWARKNCEFERGFVHHVNIWTDWQHHYGLVLSRAAPIVKITLQNVAGCAIEFAGSKWQRRILVEILGVPIIEKGIFRQFASVGADSDDPRIRDFWRKVTHPAGHQIKNGPSGWESFTIEIGDGGDRSGVDFARGHWLCAGEHIEVRCSGHRKERQFPLSNLFGVK